MPRVKPITTFTPRSKPSTQYTRPRELHTEPISFDSTEISFDSTQYTWDMISKQVGGITTIFSTPRKISLLELENGLNFELEDGNFLELEGGAKSNIIDTNWR